MTIQISNTNLNDSFNTWRLNTNYVATVMGNNVVTISRGGASDRQAYSVGNGHIVGTFTALELGATTLRGGNTSVDGDITITSNTTIGGDGLGTSRSLTVSANTTFNGNVIISTTGNEVFDQGDVSRVRISGGSNGQYLRKIRTNELDFEDLTLRQLVDLSSNSAHIILSGANTSFSEETNSPHLIFSGGVDVSDRIEMYLAGAGTIGDSDLYLKLVDAEGDSQLVITDSANVAQFTVSSDGLVNAVGDVSFDSGLTVDGSTSLNELTATTIQANGTLSVSGESSLNELTATTIQANGTLSVSGESSLNELTTTTIQANGTVQISSTLTVDGSSSLNGVTATTLTANGAASFKGDVTLGDASTDTITVKGNFANQSTTGTSVFSGAATFNSTATFNGTMTINGNVIVGDNASDTLNVTSTAALNGNTTIGDTVADKLTVNSRITSDLIANTVGAGTNKYNLGSKDLRWSRAYANTVVFGNTVINRTGTTETVLFGKNGTLHANNTINGSTITNAMLAGSIANSKLVNDGITLSANTGTSSEVQLGDTLNIVSGNAKGITVSYSSDTVTISGVDASSTVKGVAKFDSEDFSVSSGAVTLGDSINGAVLSVAGTANEVNVSRTNGTVTVGLPDSVSLTSNLTVGGKIIGGFTANGAVINLGEDRTSRTEEQKAQDYEDGDLTTLNVYANTVFHDRVTLSGGIDITGDGNFDSIINTGTTNLKGDVILGDASGDDITINGRVDTDFIPKVDDTSDFGTSSLNWKDIYVKGKIAAGATTIIGTNQKLHANNTISDSAITNAMLVNDGITVSANTGTSSEVQLGDTLSIVSGNAKGITVGYSSDTVTISGVDASTTVKGVAKFSSDNFSVSSGTVSIKDDGITLGTETTGNYMVNVEGTAGEIEVTHTQGEGSTATIGLPDDVTITSDLMVGGGAFISGNLVVSGTTTTVNTTNLQVKDSLIGLQSELTSGNVNDIGFVFNRGSTGANAVFIWDESADNFTLGTATGVGAGRSGALTVTKGTLNAKVDWSNLQNVPTYDNYGSWTLTADSGTDQTIGSGNTVDLEGGTYITTTVGATDTVTITHDDTSRTDTEGTSSPGYGGSFDVIDSVTTNDQGHVTAVNVKTITLPASDNTDTTYSTATSSVLGLVKIGFTEDGKNYPVELNGSDQMFVNVPWTDNDTWNANSKTVAGYVAAPGSVSNKVWKTDSSGNPAWRDDSDTIYSLPLAADGTRGGVQIGYAENGKNYPVELSGEKMFVNVPWTDTDTTYSEATSSVYGLVKVGYSENGQNYPVELSSGKMYVNVPWTDTNTTYSAGNGLSLNGTQFSWSGTYSNGDLLFDDTTGTKDASATINFKSDYSHTGAVPVRHNTGLLQFHGKGTDAHEHVSTDIKTSILTTTTLDNAIFGKISLGAYAAKHLNTTTTSIGSTTIDVDASAGVLVRTTQYGIKLRAFNDIEFWDDYTSTKLAFVDVSTGRIVADYGIHSTVYYDSSGTTYYADLSNTGTSINVAGSIVSAGSLAARRSGDVNLYLEAGTSSIAQINLGDSADVDAGYISYSNSTNDMTIRTNGGSYAAIFRANRNMETGGDITAAGNVTAFSDERLKENVEVIENAVDKVSQIRGVTFTRNDVEDKTKRHTGVIAQEVQKVLPEAVAGSEEETLSVAYGNMVGLLVEAIKELKQEIEELKANK